MVSNQFDYLAYGTELKQAKKLIVLLHGFGRSAVFMEKVAEEIEKKVPDAAIIVPQAPELLDLPVSDDNYILPVPQILKDDKVEQSLKRQWFTVESRDYAEMAKMIYQVSTKMNDFIDDFRDEAGLNDSDIAVMGFSQGGAVALYSAFMRDNPLACVVGHSTVFWETPFLQSKPPTYFIYGTADEEFSEQQYKGVLERLQNYLGADHLLDVSVVKGLSHKTSKESRLLTADYLADQLNKPPKP
mgnify:CR=1 FL=1